MGRARAGGASGKLRHTRLKNGTRANVWGTQGRRKQSYCVQTKGKGGMCGEDKGKHPVQRTKGEKTGLFVQGG